MSCNLGIFASCSCSTGLYEEAKHVLQRCNQHSYLMPKELLSPQWGGGRLFDGSTGFFYGSSCNSRTESQKINPKVGNERLLRGLQIDQNWGLRAKIGFLDQKPRFPAQKKCSLLEVHHVLATPGKSCSKKKVAFAQIIITQNIILSF